MTQIEMETDADARLPDPKGRRNRDGRPIMVKTALFKGQSYEVPSDEANRLEQAGLAKKVGSARGQAKAAKGPPQDKAMSGPEDAKGDDDPSWEPEPEN